MRILKFLATGAVGASVNLGTLFVLVDIANLNYILGSMLAFCSSAAVGFLLQKFWTFEEPSSSAAVYQLVLYLSVVLANLLINTLVVYTLVSMAGLHYLLAQLLGAGTVAVGSYLMYRYFVFKPRENA